MELLEGFAYVPSEVPGEVTCLFTSLASSSMLQNFKEEPVVVTSSASMNGSSASERCGDSPDDACSVVVSVPASAAVTARATTGGAGRLKRSPERPWRDIPLSEFPQAWSTGLSAEVNGGPPGPDWVCGPCVCTSVSTDLERGNFMVLWNRMCALPRPDMRLPPTDWAVVLGTHWTAGEMEFLFVRPGSEAHKLCDQIRHELAEYPDLTRPRKA